MWSDPLVEEVRQIRRDIEDKCQDNPEAFYQHILEVQQSIKKQLICREPKPALVSSGPSLAHRGQRGNPVVGSPLPSSLSRNPGWTIIR